MHPAASAHPHAPAPAITLTPAQQQALAAVLARRLALQIQTPGALAQPQATPYRAIHIHFQPDWLVNGAMVIAHLATSGRYCTQFETGTSNGSYSPAPGGQRWQWEHDWFAAAYDDAPADQRPVYGAVQASLAATSLAATAATPPASYGAAPRFGSAYLQLHPQLAARSSFCDPDSYWQPTHWGHWQHMDWQHLACLALPDPLDHYVEAHVHGGLVLQRDVAAIVLDPSFANTGVADWAARTGVALRFHAGYRLDAQQLPTAAAYRGVEVADALGDMLQRLANAAAGAAPLPHLTPASLGHAQASGRYGAQVLKKAWHCLAQLGAQPHHR